MLKDILDLANEIDHVRFNWIKKEVNETTYLLVKWGLVNNWNDFVNVVVLPDQFVFVIKRDAPSYMCSFCWIKLDICQKKKKKRCASNHFLQEALWQNDD